MKKNSYVIIETLDFKGDIKGGQANNAPDTNGIYVAFACKKKGNLYIPCRVLYIGKAEGEDSIRQRIDDHYNDHDNSDSGKQSYWEKNYCNRDEVVIYSYAECSEHIDDIEAALIRRNQPVANIQGKDHYIGKAWFVFVKCTGQRGCLAQKNSVMRLLRVLK